MDILEGHVNAGDRIAYYEALSSFGIAYGNLALGVVLNSTPSGAAANAFFLNRAQTEGENISDNQLAQISLELMQEDFRLRSQAGGAELNVDDIQRYHEDVFLDFNVSSDAWTPNVYLDDLANFGDRQAAWERMLTSSTVATFTEIFGHFGSLPVTNTDSWCFPALISAGWDNTEERKCVRS